MSTLKGFQKKYLRGLAHGIKPVVFIGQKGLNDAVTRSMDEALDHHELVKVKFIEFKEKEQKQQLVEAIEKQSGCESAGIIGHTAIFFRQNSDPEKRKITIPTKNTD